MSVTYSEIKTLFDYQLQKASYACTWNAAGTKWTLCPSAIMFTPTDEPDSTPTGVGDKPVNKKIQENPELAYPERLFSKLTSGELSSDFSDCIPLGGHLASLKTGLTIDIGDDIPMRHYQLLNPGLVEAWDKFETKELRLYGKLKFLVVYLASGTSGIYIFYGYQKQPENIQIQGPDNDVMVPSRWRDSENCYTKVRKEKKMPLPKLDANEIDNVLDSAKVPPKEEPVKEAVKEGPKKKELEKVEEVPVQETKAEPVKEPVKTVEVVQEAKEPAAEPVKEAPERKRKKADVTPVSDLTKIIEQLGGAIPENLTADEAQKAIRQLRDLILAASRRAANISLAYIDATEASVKTLAAIKAAL